MKKLLIILTLCASSLFAKAQIEEPVKWSYGSKKISETEGVLFLKATINEGWHLYSAYQGLGGPVKTSFKFKPSKDYLKVGKITEPKPNTVFSQTFGINVSSFEKEVVFQQRVKLRQFKQEKPVVINGSVEFMACTDHKCLSPETVDFSITLNK
jgi:DsbC/DsbD-like thiol-disulfide interchange protein